MTTRYDLKAYIDDVRNIESGLGVKNIHDLRAPSSLFIHYSDKFPKYSEFTPKLIPGGKKSKRFFVKDFAEEFSLVGEIEYTGEDWPVMLLEKCDFKLGYELNIHVKEEVIKEEDEYGRLEVKGFNDNSIRLDTKTIEFCDRQIVISIGNWGKKVLSATPIGEGLLEIKSASKWVSTTSLLVKRGKPFSLPGHLEVYANWLEDLQNVIEAPQKSNMLFFSIYSNYYYPFEYCRVLHLENMFGMFSITAAFLNFCGEGLFYGTLRRKNDSSYEIYLGQLPTRCMLEISMVQGLYVGDNLTCEANKSQILCNYKGYRMTLEFKDCNEPVEIIRHQYVCNEKSEAKVFAFTERLKSFFTITTPITTSIVECITLD